ncbi:hypothetical protein BC826DRAFT_966668 [Russula brevipes]|nr:hypothetical protein BC826DRAFT_966668 [Russula brevipes]
MAYDGVLEAFFASACTPANLQAHSRMMTAASIFLVVTTIGSRLLGMGDTALVWANTILCCESATQSDTLERVTSARWLRSLPQRYMHKMGGVDANPKSTSGALLAAGLCLCLACKADVNVKYGFPQSAQDCEPAIIPKTNLANAFSLLWRDPPLTGAMMPVANATSKIKGTWLRRVVTECVQVTAVAYHDPGKGYTILRWDGTWSSASCVDFPLVYTLIAVNAIDAINATRRDSDWDGG